MDKDEYQEKVCVLLNTCKHLFENQRQKIKSNIKRRKRTKTFA